VTFPTDYPAHPTLNPESHAVHFAKGEEAQIDGVRLIVMPDSRLPLVTWSVTTRSGGYADGEEQQGLSALSDEMMRHGAGKRTFEQLNEELDSRAISVEISDG